VTSRFNLVARLPADVVGGILGSVLAGLLTVRQTWHSLDPRPRSGAHLAAGHGRGKQLFEADAAGLMLIDREGRLRWAARGWMRRRPLSCWRPGSSRPRLLTAAGRPITRANSRTPAP
jgi:hypothetical protein